ncbi:hypothetical protein CRYUN_Cryun25bG0022900 [Craigia yunnanensis]
MMRDWFSPLVSLLVFLCLALRSTNGTDTILQGQTITHPKTLISSGGKFELGFFSPGNTSKYYLGIWHKVSKQPIVWVANREDPFQSGSNLTINTEGKLVISNGRLSFEGSKPYWNDSLREFENHWIYDRGFKKYDYVTWGPLDISGITHMSSKCSDRRCGVFSVCNITADRPCSCLRGFQSLSRNSSSEHQTSAQGCVRKTNLQCNDSTGDHIRNYRFHLMKYIDFPSDQGAFNVSSVLACEGACVWDCSCIAYSFDNKLGCLAWYGNLFNLKQLAKNDANRKTFYLKLPDSEFFTKDSSSTNGIMKDNKIIANKMQLWIIVLLTISLSMLMLGLLIHYVRRKLQVKGEDLLIFDLAISLKADDTELTEANMGSVRRKPEVKLPLFSFASVSAATDKFSATNKLGEGGFGPVYKGSLCTGQDIAVKRLSNNSQQGLEEFKNEVVLIAKLQHRNLVRLLGYCIHGEERILVYEFMPNNSLDNFIFDQTRSKLLGWHSRMHIIEGIARGLLYLHHDSRLRIIHRDLKASNILLDNSMNPKISDFGLARMFGVDQTQANTKRVVGTYGYMSPEYVLDGLFSMKSDVFSFGVLVLEIVTGKRNRGFSNPDHDHNLLGHAWRLWMEERPLELIDNALGDTYNVAEVLRCINVALLCVQQRPEDRPNMSLVVLMLCGESILSQPKQPGFFIERNLPLADSMSVKSESYSIYGYTSTSLEPR